MPKITNDWKNYKNASENRSKAKNNNMKTADVFSRPKAGETVRGRIIGFPIDFIAHWPRVDEGERKDDGSIIWKNEDFVDADERNHKPTRICTDDTPARDRYKDTEGYLKKTKCPWCKMRYQGYMGNLRHAFNIILRPSNSCRILEVPPTVMGELSQICRDAADLMPNGPGDVAGEVFEFVFSRVNENKWSVQRYPNLDITDANISSYLVGLTDEDRRALKLINPDAETEEDLLRGHDLERWYRKDYLSAELQQKFASQLGLKSGEYLELSPYEQARGVGETSESFENEEDDIPENDISEEEIEKINSNVSDDEWGSVGGGEEDVTGNQDADDDSPLW